MTLRQIKILTIGMLVGLVSGCMSPAYEYRKAPVVTELTVPMGKTLVAGQTGLSVSFDKIVSDSRCAINARCVWEGVAIVNATVSNTTGERKTLKLSTINFEDVNRAEEAFGQRIRLLDVLPKPVAGSGAKPELTTPSIKVRIE